MTDSEVRRQILENVAGKAGYTLGHVDNLAHPSGRLAAELLHDGDFDTANYIGAWYGLLAREPRTAVFHEHADGPDVLHTWTTGARKENVLEAAKDLPHFVMSDNGRVYAMDQGRRGTHRIMMLARATRAQDHQAHAGTGQFIGGTAGPDSASRQSYKNVIRGYENAAS